MNNQIQSGNGKRAVIGALCGVLALGTFIVQWRVISQLRRENEALRTAQQSAIGEIQLAESASQTEPAAQRAAAPSGDQERIQQEKTELLRLRNEVRQLRANVAPDQGTSTATFAHEQFTQSPSTAILRTGLTSEWRGMEEFATNKYAQALERLAKADHYIERFMALGDVAKMNYAFGRTEDAQASATELLALAEKYKGEIWSRGACGQAVHDGNLVLGRLALEQGAIEDAKQYLLEAGTSDGSPVLGSFGPNMSLARELLEKGERETVLQYFERCEKFWSAGKLKQWTDEVNAGLIPDFGSNRF